MAAENADDLEADAIDADVLTHRIAAGEEFFLGLGADDGDASALKLVLGVIETSLIDGEGADVESIGILAVTLHRCKSGSRIAWSPVYRNWE